jgi:dimethylargininase
MSYFASTASNRLGRAVIGRQRIASFVGRCRHSRGYALAISRDVPSSFASALTKYSNDEEPVDLANAKKQHKMYLQQLRTLVPTYCLPALDDHPDSIFVEDTVVAIGNTAVITNPGHPSRRGEVDTIKDVLVRLGMDVIDMRAENEDAICDGGDVLNAPRHLFVGLSERTNLAAVEVLANAFDVETISVPFDKSNALHLTSIVSHMDSNTLLAPTGVVGDQALEAMRYNELGYDVIRLPNMLACNVVAVNGGILAQDGGCQESRALLISAAAERGLIIHFVDASEIAKVDGALTCCSVLLMGK